VGEGVAYADERATLHALSTAVLAVTQHMSTREVLQMIVESARTLLDARYAALGVPDDRGAFAQFLTSGVSEEERRAIGPLPRQHGLLGAMLREARAERIVDIRADPRFEGWPAAHPELADFLGMPIRASGQVMGAIYLANKCGGGGFSEDDEHLLGVLAAHAAIALTNARLFERSRELALVEERNRIARELHDAVAQKLFSLRLTAEAAAVLVERDPARAREELARVQRLSAEALAELRAVVVEMRPPDLDEDGLVGALRKHVEVLGRVHDARLIFHGTDLPVLSRSREEVVLRIAQEALHNALRHAHADTVEVTLGRRRRGGVCVEIRDDGIGFDVAASRAHGHLGLVSMRERAESVGGRLVVTSSAGRGTTVLLELPRG
jgi:signal transduction histidine kinase